MKLKEYSKAELEAMSYDDIAFLILSESKKKMKINDLFKKVCDLLGLPESVFTDKIADFFEVLSTDQRFIMLPNGSWDLKTKHSAKIVIDEEEDDLADAIDEDEEEFESEEEEDIYYDADETDDQSEDDLKDLVIIDEDEEANGLN